METAAVPQAGSPWGVRTDIQVVSDLHIHNLRIPFPATADTLIIAGDTGSFVLGYVIPSWFLRRLARRYKAVIWIMGNHEQFSLVRRTCQSIERRMRKISARTKTVFLHNDTYDLDDGVTRVLGTPLYVRIPEHVGRVCDVRPSDGRYFWIRGEDGKRRNLTVPEYNAMFYQSVAFLQRELLRCRADGKRAVVVTHYAPLMDWQALPEDRDIYAMSGTFPCGHYNRDADMAPAFDECLRTAAVWVYGHTHVSVAREVVLGKQHCRIPIISNQRGFIKERKMSGWNPQLTITVGEPCSLHACPSAATQQRRLWDHMLGEEDSGDM